MKMNRKTILPAGLILLVTGFIFSNSFKGIEASRADSDVVLGWFRPLLERLFGPNAELMDFIVRKAAHMTEYAILFWLYRHALALSGAKHPAAAALVMSACYAATDEWHQGFVEDRGPSAIDVGIDTLGASLAWGAQEIAGKIRKKER